VADNVPVAPTYSGLDGGMNKVFLAVLPGRIIPLAKVLPNGSQLLPQMPSVPWTDNDGSVANELFGALLESKSTSQTQVASTASTPGRAADSATAGSTVTPTTKPAP